MIKISNNVLSRGKLTFIPKPDASMISGVSVDIRLGNEFRVFKNNTAPFIDLSGPREEVQQQMNAVMSEEIVVPDGEAFFLTPG